MSFDAEGAHGICTFSGIIAESLLLAGLIFEFIWCVGFFSGIDIACQKEQSDYEQKNDPKFFQTISPFVNIDQFVKILITQVMGWQYLFYEL